MKKTLFLLLFLISATAAANELEMISNSPGAIPAAGNRDSTNPVISLDGNTAAFQTKADNLSGCVAGLKGELPDIVDKIKIEKNLFKEIIGTEGHREVEELKLSDLLMISANTSISVGKITKIDGDTIDLELNIPIVPFKGDNIGLARNIEGHWRLIGFGVII